MTRRGSRLHRAVEGRAFAPADGPTFAPFDLGLGLMLDGIDRLIERQTSA